MVYIAERALPNLDLGLSAGRWAFPPTVRSHDLGSIEVGDLVFFGVGGNPRALGGGKFNGWQRRRLREAYIARVTRKPFENLEPFWIDERLENVVRWNPTIEIELVRVDDHVSLTAGDQLSLDATNALYRGGVSHKAFLISTAGSPVFADLPPGVLDVPRVGRRSPDQQRERCPRVRQVAVETERLREALVRARIATTADPRESRLVHEYIGVLRTRRHSVTRLRIDLLSGETIYSDLFCPERQLLVEAKNSASRAAIRTAIGQLIDYGRHREKATRAVLVPEQPNDDLLALLAGVGIEAIWRSGTGFADTRQGSLC